MVPSADNGSYPRLGYAGTTIPESWLEVKESTIPQAGLGVFAARDIPKGTVLGLYEGKQYRTLKGIGKKDKSAKPPQDSDYVFEVPDNTTKKYRYFIDALDQNKSNWTRWINTTKIESCNVSVVHHCAPGTFSPRSVIFITGRELKTNEELFFDYGDFYSPLVKILGTRKQQIARLKRKKYHTKEQREFLMNMLNES